MPNPDLNDTLTDTLTRRRLYDYGVAGGDAPAFEDVADIRAQVRYIRRRPGTDGMEATPEREWVVVVDPEADVVAPVPGPVGHRDVLVISSGPYAGVRLDAEFVRHHTLIARREVECREPVRERVTATFVTETREKDAGGGHSIEPADGPSRWAAVIPVSASDQPKGMAEGVTVTHRIEVLYDAALASYRRIRAGAVELEVRTVLDPDGRQRELHFLCEST